MTTTGVDPGGAKATAAGIYDAILGGTENTEADQAVVTRLLELEPQLREASWANRGFLQRAAGWMARQGVRRFVDIGAGLPTMANTHDIVHAIDAGSQVIYIDNDPAAVARGRELLAGVDNASYIQQDLISDDLLEDPQLAAVLGAGEPVGLLLVAVLHLIADEADPVGRVRRLVEAIPAGSYLAISHAISDRQPAETIRTGTQVYRTQSTANLVLRTKDEVAKFLHGLEIVPPYPGAEPTLAYIGLWGAEDPTAADDDPSRWQVAAVAQKP